MARQLRIQYPGAFYHVFSRGNQKQPVFLSDEDRCIFIACLRKTCEKFNIAVHAYCLMPNHFHLLLETPLGNLSRAMHFLVTKYTVYFNKKHKRQGHLFQGRYRAVLVDVVSYARELSRYIHLNPVRAQIVNSPDEYPWSSYGYFTGLAKPEGWLETSVVLRLFNDRAEAAQEIYARYVYQGIGKETLDPIRKAIQIGMLGSEEFIARIKRKYLGIEMGSSDREKPQLRRLAKSPDLATIFSISERVLGPKSRHLVPIAVFVCHKKASYKLREIGEFLSLSISGVANASKRAQVAMLGNSVLVRAVEEIERTLNG